MKITNTAIRSMKYKGGWDVRWDDQISGFGVRLFESGRKSFVLSYRLNGRKRTYTLGQAGRITLDQARKAAQKTLADIHQGIDPADAKRSRAKQKTLKELCDIYISDHSKVHNKTWKEDARRIQNYLIPALGSRKVNDISRADVQKLHNAIGENKPYEANRVLALVSSMYGKAIDWGILEESAINPATRIKTFKEEKRDRWVTQQEMPRLIKAIAEEENIFARQLFLLYLLTAARKNELMQAKWENIDWERRTLRLDDTKAGRVFYIPLSDAAIEQFKKIPKMENNPYIFAGKNKGQPLKDIKRPWQRVRKAAGLDDVRLHDLRRTVGSWLAEAGESLNLIGDILNHSNVSTTSIYAHLSDHSRHRAIQQHGERMRKVISAL